MYKKRGQANILTTVLIITLVIVGIAILYNIVKPLVSEKSGDISSATKNLQLQTALSVKNYQSVFNPYLNLSSINVTVTADSSQTSVTGILFKIYTNTSACYVNKSVNPPMQALETRIFYLTTECIGITKVEIYSVSGTTGTQTIKCYNDTDCGNIIITRYCSNDSRACGSSVTPNCQFPGTTDSYCMNASGGGCTPICTFGCSNGACLNLLSLDNEDSASSNGTYLYNPSNGYDENWNTYSYLQGDTSYREARHGYIFENYNWRNSFNREIILDSKFCIPTGRTDLDEIYIYYDCWNYSKNDWSQIYRWQGRTYPTGMCGSTRGDKEVNNTIPRDCINLGNNLKIRTHLQSSVFSGGGDASNVRQYENALIVLDANDSQTIPITSCGNGVCDGSKTSLVSINFSITLNFKGKDYNISVISLNNSDYSAVLNINGHSLTVSEENLFYDIYDGTRFELRDVNHDNIEFVLGENFGSCPEDCGTTCVDEDGGKNYYVRGWTYGTLSNPFVEEDYCSGIPPDLLEFNCNYSKSGWENAYVTFACPNGCLDGACINQTPTSCGNGVCDVGSYNNISNGELRTFYLGGIPYTVSVLVSSSTQVQFTVNGITTSKLSSGGTTILNGIKVYVGNITYQNYVGGIQMAEFKLGEDLVSCPGDCPIINQTCTDSDGGLNYYLKGTIRVNGGYIADDTCYTLVSPNRLQEFYCTTDGSYTMANYDCPNGCSNGACIALNQTTNIALNKNTKQSTTYPAVAGYPSFASSSAVDGSTSSFQHTYNNLNEWWAVDLGQVYGLSSINIIKRNGYCTRPANYLIQSADDFNFTQNVRTLVAKTSDSSCNVAISSANLMNVSTRYLRVYDTASEYLNIAEFQVYKS